MIQVHHLNNSRSQRILWLLEELGRDYEIIHYQRDPVTRLAPPALKAVHPLGKSPVITDGELVVMGGLAENKETEARNGLAFLPSFLHTKTTDKTQTEILLILQVSKI